jgi:hypothetical protein
LNNLKFLFIVTNSCFVPKTSFAVIQDDNTIDLSGQPSGVYLYRVMDASGALVGEGKFVIQK